MPFFRPEGKSLPYPFGAVKIPGKETLWNFAIFSEAPISHLIVQDLSRSSPPLAFPLNESCNKTGHVWHYSISSRRNNFLWCWAIYDPIQDSYTSIQDPYAKLLDTGITWGDNSWKMARTEKLFPLAITYDWEAFSSRTEHFEKKELSPIIYEAHLRGFTKDPSSTVTHPGTFSGAQEKLDHLKRLGVSALELMPLTEFDESEWARKDPETGDLLFNYWGYSPLSFFAPCGRYFSSDDPLLWPEELANFVNECHKRGLLVLLDVVFNHTGEGNQHGPSYSWKRTSPHAYYLIDENGYANYSGCGNTFNANHPMASHMILEALRHWVLVYKIDGFRFDLASCLTRNQNGFPMQEPLLLELIAKDSILSNTLLITEPWDASGLYQTGFLYQLNQQHKPLFSEWNDRFRDDVRRFLSGRDGFSGYFASRMCGSRDMYPLATSPLCSINYVTAHDGFSLKDLVSYNVKHNERNGEHNRDGCDHNNSWNSGIEGPSHDSSIIDLRLRRLQNYLVALLLSHGIPMLHMGDEYGHTKSGNNNSWCHDAPINWFQWKQLQLDSSIYHFIETLIDIRVSSKLFSPEQFVAQPQIAWHGYTPYAPNWEPSNRLVAYTLLDEQEHPRLYLAFSMSNHETHITIPPPRPSDSWKTYVNTGLRRPENFFGRHHARAISSHRITLKPYSTLVLGTF